MEEPKCFLIKYTNNQKISREKIQQYLTNFLNEEGIVDYNFHPNYFNITIEDNDQAQSFYHKYRYTTFKYTENEEIFINCQVTLAKFSHTKGNIKYKTTKKDCIPSLEEVHRMFEDHGYNLSFVGENTNYKGGYLVYFMGEDDLKNPPPTIDYLKCVKENDCQLGKEKKSNSEASQTQKPEPSNKMPIIKRPDNAKAVVFVKQNQDPNSRHTSNEEDQDKQIRNELQKIEEKKKDLEARELKLAENEERIRIELQKIEEEKMNLNNAKQEYENAKNQYNIEKQKLEEFNERMEMFLGLKIEFPQNFNFRDYRLGNARLFCKSFVDNAALNLFKLGK